VRYAAPAELPIAIAADAHFGESIVLDSYALSADSLHPGDVLQVRFDWQTSAPLTTRYKVFLQLLNADGTLVAQRDSEPGGGLALTTGWTPGQQVQDRHALLLPADLPPGAYTLIAGLYDLNDSSARLPVKGGTYLSLATITVK
jgi:mannosyltransferase